jgi:hypothetical protein
LGIPSQNVGAWGFTNPLFDAGICDDETDARIVIHDDINTFTIDQGCFICKRAEHAATAEQKRNSQYA